MILCAARRTTPRVGLNLVTYLFTYLPTQSVARSLTPRQLTFTQLVEKFPVFYGTRWFITVFTPVPILSRINPVNAPIPLPEDPS